MNRARPTFFIRPAPKAPLVAIAADFDDLQKTALGRQTPAGSQVVISSRLDLVLRSLDLVNRIAERQRVVLLVDARRRQDIIPLRRHGWHLWEPQPQELLPVHSQAAEIRTGVVGLDRTLRSAKAERDSSTLFVDGSSPSLSAAFASLTEIGERIRTTEAAAFDERVQESFELATTLFFQASDELSGLARGKVDEYQVSLDQLRREAGYIGRYFGAPSADAITQLAANLQIFLKEAATNGMTPKGKMLIEQARARPDSIFVTGNSHSKDRAATFLETASIPVRCVQPADLADADEVHSVTAFSILGREKFARLVDPWPSQNVLFAGYEFENDIYRRRLKLRSVQKRNLRLNDEERQRVTCCSSASPMSPVEEQPEKEGPNRDPVKELDAVVEAGRWDWSRRLHIPRPSAGESTLEARVVRFAGRSWMPATDDHRLLCLRVSPSKNVPGVEQLLLEDIGTGTRILAREGGEKDVIRTIARQLCGEDKYEFLRAHAGLWRTALLSSRLDPRNIAKALAQAGVRKHTATIRGWLMDDARIGPRSDDDVNAIAATFPLPGKGPRDWKICCDAISELRGLHLSAGAKLTDQLFSRCGSMLLEEADSEIAVEFDLGVVWMLTVVAVEPEPKTCPVSIINRVQWIDPKWRDRLFEERIRGG
ncbi:MAG: DrmE family protein [Acidobacteriota bacterium]